MNELIDEKPLRVLHVTTVPETLKFVVGHIAHAKRKGFEVHAMSSPGELLDNIGRMLQIEVHPVVMPRRITPLSDLGAVWRMARAMRRIRPTLVDGHTPKGGLLAMMAATIARVPIKIYHMHGLPLMTATGLKSRILHWSEWTACKLANQVLVVSESVRQVAIAKGLCPADKIKVLGTGTIDGVDAKTEFNPLRLAPDTRQLVRQRYQIPADAPVVGFAGRIVRDKGVIELTGAWQKLRAEFPNAHLLIAGPFESQDPVPAEVEAALRSDPRVHLAGLVNDMPSIYRAIDVFALPTYREGFSTVLLEASAMELPLVATRVPGVVDAVRDGETGALVPARDAEALASAVGAYLRDRDLSRRHGLNGRGWVLRGGDP